MALSNSNFFYVNSNFVDTSNVLSNYINLTNINNLDSEETQLSKHARNLFFSPSYNKKLFDSINWANNLGIYKNQNLLLNPLVDNVLIAPVVNGFFGGIFDYGGINNYYTVVGEIFNPFNYSNVEIKAYKDSKQILLDLINIEFRNEVSGNSIVPIDNVLTISNPIANINQVGPIFQQYIVMS